MKRQTRVVFTGGGIAGCSTLKRLTQEGWADVVLIETVPARATDPDLYDLKYEKIRA